MSAGNQEDKTVPTPVKGLKDHKIVCVSCGSGDAHTVALEDNGNDILLFFCLLILMRAAVISLHRDGVVVG